MNETIIITILSLAIVIIFRWSAYRFQQPNIKILIKSEYDTIGYMKIIITAYNSSGRNASIDASQSFLQIQNLSKNITKKFNLNFKDPSTDSFEDVIPSNSKNLVSSFRFNYPIQILTVSIKDKSTQISWRPSKKNLNEINKFLLEFFSFR